MKVFVIAGEPSGDALGGALMAGLKAQAGAPVVFVGIGGPRMQAEGLESRFDMSELSLMGLVEILPKYFHLKRRIRETAQAVIAARPDVLITIDSPDFCLRVARQVRAGAPDVPIVHYVAPSVWAWRAGRAAKMARYVDHVLALLPNEPELMTPHGMSCDLVGHPVVTRPVASEPERAAFRARHGLGETPLMLVLPGSRRGEVSRLAGVFGTAVAPVLAERGARAVVPTVGGRVEAMVREAVAAWPEGAPPVILSPDAEDAAADKRAAFAEAEIALAASGTVSLELAAAGTPMVIAYDMAPVTRMIMERMLTIDTVTLVNIVSETRAVPEFLGRDCRAELITPALRGVLADSAAQRAAMALTMVRLGAGQAPPGERAAASVLAFLAGRDGGAAPLR